MTKVEILLFDFIEKWHDEDMKMYTDKQYGKGEFRELLEKAREMIKKRDKEIVEDFKFAKKYLMD